MSLQAFLALSLITLSYAQVPATASLSALATVDGQYAASGFALNT